MDARGGRVRVSAASLAGLRGAVKRLGRSPRRVSVPIKAGAGPLVLPTALSASGATTRRAIHILRE